MNGGGRESASEVVWGGYWFEDFVFVGPGRRGSFFGGEGDRRGDFFFEGGGRHRGFFGGEGSSGAVNGFGGIGLVLGRGPGSEGESVSESEGSGDSVCRCGGEVSVRNRCDGVEILSRGVESSCRGGWSGGVVGSGSVSGSEKAILSGPWLLCLTELDKRRAE